MTQQQETPLDVNDVIGSLMQAIAGQALEIAKLEALNKKLMGQLQKKEEKG